MIINVMERHVHEAYARLRGAIPGFVDTPQHHDDVIVYALNRLPARYVVTNEGKAVTEVALDGAQHRTTIEVQVIEAMRYVAQRPRPDAQPATVAPPSSPPHPPPSAPPAPGGGAHRPGGG